VDWPVWPKDYKVTWDLEPREQAEEADEKAGLKQPAKQPARA
jgi:pyruvate dehydrogenase E1 component alpha subunit